MAAYTVVDFTPEGNSAQFVAKGWGITEPHGRWTTLHDATLILPGVPNPPGCVVEIQIWPYVIPEKVPFQDVIIYVNEVRTIAVRLSRAEPIRFRLPAGAVAPDAPITLRLRCPHAVQPRTVVDSVDGRFLGVSVKRLALRDALADDGKAIAGQAAETATAPEISPAVPGAVAPTAPRVAAVTMVYNEDVFLPIWLKHYGKQVGLENCYVVDHGSTDGSTDNLGPATVLRIPRSPYDPHLQSKWNSEFCSSLLNWYDWVVYSDVDEMLVVDPNIAPTITEYVKRDIPDVVTAVGLNSIHCTENEPALDLSRPITEQRPYVFTSSSMCKPLLTRRPIVWSPGSHAANAPTVFDHLYLFHLRWFDLPQGMIRLQKTRIMPWARTDVGQYQRVEDDKLAAQYSGRARMPAIDDMDFDASTGPLRDFLAEVLATRNEDPGTPYRISLDIWGKKRWRIPKRFIGSF